jgi:hypothetical protein
MPFTDDDVNAFVVKRWPDKYVMLTHDAVDTEVLILSALLCLTHINYQCLDEFTDLI